MIEADFRRCFGRWAAASGRTTQEIADRFKFDASYEDHERGTLGAVDYFDGLRRALEVDLLDDVLLEGWNDIYIGPNAEIMELLAEASTHFPLYAFTNSNPSHQAVWSRRFAHELQVFDSVFVSSDIGHRKPDRAAFDSVAAAIGSPPSRIVFFDDAAENVDGALRAGMQAVHVTSSQVVRRALALVLG